MPAGIETSVQHGVGHIVFNNPQKHNALSAAMWTATERVLDDWAEDDAVRVVVLTGAGDKAFISGADIAEFESRQDEAGIEEEYNRLSGDGKARLRDFPKPAIAAIRGYCLGSGLAVAIHADIRIAAEDAIFGIPAAQMGLAYGYPSIKLLKDLVGPANAAMILYAGDRITAAEAKEMGLVNKVVPNESLLEATNKLAVRIAENAPLSIRASKLTLQLHPDRQAIKAAGIAAIKSEDHKEARQAFLEKRTPQFRGR